eukprot:g13810.t1
MASRHEGDSIDGDGRFAIEGWAPPDSLHHATNESLYQWAAGLFDELYEMVPQTRGGAPGVGVQRAVILFDELYEMAPRLAVLPLSVPCRLASDAASTTATVFLRRRTCTVVTPD